MDYAQAISLHSWCASGIHPYLSRINSPGKVSENPAAHESVVKLATEALHEQFKIGDDWLAGREYFFDHFTAPDAHFYWCCRRAGQLKVDIAGFPNVAEHYKRVEARPSVQKFIAFEKDVNEKFAKAG